MTTAGHTTPTISPTSLTGGSKSFAASEYFGGIGVVRTRTTWVSLLGLVAFGFGALPLAPRQSLMIAVGVSLTVVLGATLVLIWLGRDPVRQRRRSYDAVMLVALAGLSPTLYFLDICGPVVGYSATLLLLYNMDAPPRWGLAATLLVSVPGVATAALIMAGFLSRHALLAVHPTTAVDVSGLTTTSMIYGMSYLLGRIYRRRTRAHIEELAEAGLEIAARDALLREARLDLERVAAVGQRGRFTEQRLGSYILGNILGRGGMGEVYTAEHFETKQPAAIKLLRPRIGDSSGLLRRFEREAALVGTLQSPHIVKLLEVGGMEAAFPYMAMELLEGDTCAQLLGNEGKLPLHQVVEMVRQVAEGLAVAKQHNVVHRDIKPTNLFLTTDGTWKVLDFGIGRLAGDSGTLTGGALVGTLGYLAPEQVRGDVAVTHQTDLYALAIVAYRALTGRHAFVEREPANVLREVEKELPARPSRVVDVPTEVDDVLRIAFAKNPKDRFADARELADALAKAVRGQIDPSLRARASALDRNLTWTDGAKVLERQRPLLARPIAVLPYLARLADQAPALELAAPSPPNLEKTSRHTSPPQLPTGHSAAATTPGLSTPTLTAVLGPDIAASPTDAPSTAHSTSEATIRSEPSPRAPASESTSIIADTPKTVSLVAPTEQVIRAMARSRALAMLPALIGVVVFAVTQVPLNPHTEIHTFAYVTLGVMLFEFGAITWFARDTSDRGRRGFHIACIAALLTSTILIYTFSVFGIAPAFIGMALLIFSMGASLPAAIVALLAVAIPHIAIHLACTFGVLNDRGGLVMDASVPARLWNLAHSLGVYGLCAWVAHGYRERNRRTLQGVSEAFRQLAEREALLRDARLELERAVGVGQRGRFTDQQIGSFVLGNVLGRGGMGEVYEGSHRQTGEAVAVKLLRRRDSADANLIGRFEREAKTVAALASDHVVRVLEIGGAEAALPYIAMERLIGVDLASLLQRKLVLAPDEVADLVSQVAAGLHVAHRQGIVHRDIKPQNLFLTRDGIWKVLDFGVAGFEGDEDMSAPSQLAGTPAYMAPEQLAHGTTLDLRVDVHALACVAYRALTGRPAFSGRDSMTVIRSVLHRLPHRPSAVVDCPREVDHVLRIAMSKQRSDRFADAPTFAHALRDAIAGKRDDALAKQAEMLERELPWR